MTRYIREEWTAIRGFPGGSVTSIAQTGDGYLWVGGAKGLVRFDGIRFDLTPLPSMTADTAPWVTGVAVDGSGELWTRFRGPYLFNRKSGSFQEGFSSVGLRPSIVTAMARSIDGAILTASALHGLVRHQNGAVGLLLDASQVPRGTVTSLAQTSDGVVWFGTRDSGLFQVAKGKPVPVDLELPDQKINALLAGPSGELWVGTDRGLIEIKNNKSVPIAPALTEKTVLAMVRDRDGNLWVAAGISGLFRVNASGTSRLAVQESLVRGAVTAVFEDREGNLWVGSSVGIERLRNGAFTTFGFGSAPPSRMGAIHATANRVWVAGSEKGLFVLGRDGVTRPVIEWHDDDRIYSIGGASSDLWLGTRKGGLTHLIVNDDGIASRETFTTADGLASNTVYAVHQSTDGAIWAGTLNAGLSRFFGGRFTTFTSENGLASNSISAIDRDAAGRLWVGTSKGLSRLVADKWRTLTTNDGLPSNEINCLLARADDELWVGTASGLSLLRGGQVSPLTLPASLAAPIAGVAEDKDGSLWVSTSERVLRIKAGTFGNGAITAENVQEFDIVDGLASTEGVKRYRSAISDDRGRVWIVTSGGVSMADPRVIATLAARPIVGIDQVLIDGVPVAPSPTLAFTSNHQRLVVSFIGIALTVPERIKFRYRLDNFDSKWSDPLPDRQAVYTNLRPGSYTFRVIAENESAAADPVLLAFRVDPMFWQTAWFRIGILS